MIHTDSRFAIYFGDAQDHMYPQEYLQWSSADLMQHQRVKELAEQLSIDGFIFLNQVHGTEGIFVSRSQAAAIEPFSIEGDFLITTEPHLGIGVMTADCLPVICYDQQRHIVGIAHAGWRGALGGVVDRMLDRMHDRYGTQRVDTLFFLGPSAQECCYQVDMNFRRYLAPYDFVSTVLERRRESLYFDLPGFVVQQLIHGGVTVRQISCRYSFCTIGDNQFCSHRRATQAKTAASEGRQMTVVVLR